MPRDGWGKDQTDRRIKNGGIAASVFYSVAELHLRFDRYQATLPGLGRARTVLCAIGGKAENIREYVRFRTRNGHPGA
jgi:hypothetical protein